MLKIPAFQINLERVTGHADGHPVIEIKRFDPATDIWRIADEVLLGWAEQAPEDGTYLRVEFSVIYADGSFYSGFYLLERANATDPALAPDIAAEVRACAETFAGRRRPQSLRTKEEYMELLRAFGRVSRERYTALLDSYEIPGPADDHPSPPPEAFPFAQPAARRPPEVSA